MRPLAHSPYLLYHRLQHFFILLPSLSSSYLDLHSYSFNLHSSTFFHISPSSYSLQPETYIPQIQGSSRISLLTVMEDYNIPSTERVALLQRLQEAVGDVPPYFWAACQICDLKILEKLVECACILPELVCLVADQTRSMILHCRQSHIPSLWYS